MTSGIRIKKHAVVCEIAGALTAKLR